MKIRWIELENFRKFSGTIRVNGIADGVNLLVGRNELGKSTLLAAINGVIFEKAKSQSQQVRSFRHFADGTVPRVSMGFELDDSQWTLRKRFAGQAGKALLECSDGKRFEDEAAEDRLQRLLGFAPGARNAEPGIWGTLWVRQGDSFHDPDLDEPARRTLQSCLERQVGAVTGGLRGQRIPEAIERDLNDLTSTRGPRGSYKEASEQLETARARVNELEGKCKDLFDRMSRLAELHRELKGFQSDWDEAAHRQWLEAERKSRSEALAKSVKIEAARNSSKLADNRAEQAQEGVRERGQLAAEVARLERDVEALHTKFAVAQAQQASARGMVEAQELQLARLRDRERLAGEQSRRLERIRAAAILASTVSRCDATLAEAAQLQHHVERLAHEIGGIAATQESVTLIEDATTAFSAAEAALQAVATTIAITVRPEAVAAISVNDAPLTTGEASFPIVARTTIDVKAVGRITVEPQIKGRDAMVEELALAKEALKTSLEAAAATTLAEARSSAARRAELRRQLEQARRDIARLAPGDRKNHLSPGFDALRERANELRGRLAAETKQLEIESLPTSDEIDQQIRDAHAAAERLASEISTFSLGLAEPKAVLTRAELEAQALQQRLASATDALETTMAKLAVGRATVGDEVLQVQADELARKATEERRILAEIEREQGETIATIEARIRRLEAAERNQASSVANLNIEITRLATWIEANEGAGLEEELEITKSDVARLETRLRDYDLEVRTLKLLLDTLRTAEREAKARYLAPVVTRVRPYLDVLLPGAEIVLDENFHIAAVHRNGAEEAFDYLSAGTQEQIAVLTRLAFAELLLDEGRPATIILDDALVFSDDDRIERMFDIMTRAGEKTQIIVLTCRRRLFTRLGATVLRIEGDQSEQL
jgi:DNA repair exonuclease SbcCD ATPase subunit